MTTNTDLAQLHKMFTAADIEHHYSREGCIITVTRGDHAWTVSEDYIIYWGDSSDVCKTRWRYRSWVADAYDYISDVYSKAQ